MRVQKLVILCMLFFLGHSCAVFSQVADSVGSTKSFAISGFALKNGDFSKTMFLSLNYRQLTKRKWLGVYASGNYHQYDVLNSFRSITANHTLEFGVFVPLRLKKFECSLYTGLAYHNQVHSSIFRVIKYQGLAVAPSVEVSYHIKKMAFGLVAGTTFGRGPTHSYFPDGTEKKEILFGGFPKLGVVVRYSIF